MCEAMNKIQEKMVATLEVLSEQNTIKTEYIKSLEHGYQQLKKEYENLKTEHNKKTKIIWSLDTNRRNWQQKTYL
jgi:uncharacterized membrane protein